jgi:hypothetical protein
MIRIDIHEDRILPLLPKSVPDIHGRGTGLREGKGGQNEKTKGFHRILASAHV